MPSIKNQPDLDIVVTRIRVQGEWAELNEPKTIKLTFKEGFILNTLLTNDCFGKGAQAAIAGFEIRASVLKSEGELIELTQANYELLKQACLTHEYNSSVAYQFVSFMKAILHPEVS